MDEKRDNAASTPWRTGRFDSGARKAQLLFGQMYEDPSVEVQIFGAALKKRIFCIASAGCMAIALAAAGHNVTAVDINPAQIAYVRARLEGGGIQEGAADRLLARGRKLFWLLGWRNSLLRQFLAMEDLQEQSAFWKSQLDTVRWRITVDQLLHPRLLQAVYTAPFVRALPPNFGSKIRARMERCWKAYPNRSNPYAWRLLLGTSAETSVKAINFENPIELICSDAASFLESCAPGTFDGFSLSNILDGAPVDYRTRLLRSVSKAGTVDSIMVLRSFSEPSNEDELSWAARDKSMLWGAVTAAKTHSV
ncbi:MAG TPA: DUF3419 family protein [Terriglobales bacterium]|nr:DUF3419 family protein [Terriglobales bacterium]